MKHPRTVARKRRKKLFVDLFGGKCEICGYDKCLNALSFHHKDPTTKEGDIQKIIYNRTFDFALVEIKKCMLLCMNCHAEVHSEEYDFEYRQLYQQWETYICKFCGKTFEAKPRADERIRKFCSDKCTQLSQRRVDRPSKEELKVLIAENSMVAIGRMFGVSDNTIRKWAKKYGMVV